MRAFEEAQLSNQQYIDKILEDLKKDLSQHSPPIVRYNKGYISATYDFDFGCIPKVKIRALKKSWLTLWDNFDALTFKDIEPFLGRKTDIEKKRALESYASINSDCFEEDLFLCIQYANAENPDFFPIKRPRKNIYNLTRADKWGVSQTAIRLYVFFTEEQWHDHMEDFLKKYGLKQSDIHNTTAEKRRNAVEKVISEYYGPDFGSRFWQTFVKESPISLNRMLHIERERKTINPTDDPWLAELFQEFKRPSK
jgi:hypothetical protein